MRKYEVLLDPLYESGTDTNDETRWEREASFLLEKVKSKTVIFHYFDSAFFDEYVELGEMTERELSDRADALAIKDGIDVVRYDNGNYGIVAYYSGNINGFEVIEL